MEAWALGGGVSWIYILVLDIFCQQFGDIWQLEGVCAPFGRWVGENMCQLNIYICIGYILPTFGGYMTVRGCLCALWALGWETKKLLKKFPWCQIVLVSNCPGTVLLCSNNMAEHLSQPSAQRAHRHPPTVIYPPNVGRIYPIQIYLSYWHMFPNPAPEGRTDTLQL